MHIIEEAFGKDCNLYSDVLNCPTDADAASLRKAYYRTALKYHPDKNPTLQSNESNRKFHAITAAYQILCNSELRTEYDATGKIPYHENDVGDDDDEFNDRDGCNCNGNPWKDYFDRIFGKVSMSAIDSFASKYKCSDDERHERGDLIKMLHHVMLSEPCDATRWVEDYIQPAMDNGTVSSSYTSTMKNTLSQLQKRVEKERKKAKFKSEEEEDGDDEDNHVDDDMEDETEDLEDTKPPPKKAKPSTKAKRPPTMAKATNSKGKKPSTKKNQTDRMSDLISQIQNKNRNNNNNNSGTVWSNLGARYGVHDDDDDPIPDEAVFQRAKAKLKKGTKKT
jgi:DnaJ homolog subfamily C member 9